MVKPTINMVTTTATATEPDAWDPAGTGGWGSNSEIDDTTMLNYGTVNIDANAWTAVKVAWAYVNNMEGNSSIANMGFYVDGSIGTGMARYHKITSTWENPTSTGNEQQTGSSVTGLDANNMSPVTRSSGESTMTTAGQRSQYIYGQYSVLSSVNTGAKTTGDGTGKAIFAYTYS